MVFSRRQLSVLFSAIAVGSCQLLGGEPTSSPPLSLAGGTVVVCWQPELHGTPPTDLLVHFHGDPQTLQKALSRTELDVVVAVNFKGLSSAYSKPFADDPTLFQLIVDHAGQTSFQQGLVSEKQRWSRVVVSSFSAGYGAVREILKSPGALEQIDSLVAADSIYAGLDESLAERVVSAENMSGFLKFAELAVQGKKAFVITHSAQQTPYASTTETADYLLNSLAISRERQVVDWSNSLHQTSLGRAGQFLVFGFSGESGPDHVEHLRQIDRIWNRLPPTGPQEP